MSMSELARNFASRLRHFISDRRRAERLKANFPVEVSILDEHNRPLRRGQSTHGHTLDISATGLALIVPVIRISDHYLAGEDRRLLLKLESPTGPIGIQVTPVRYERLDESESELGYLIGVSITSMSDEDKERYEKLLSDIAHGKKEAPDKR
jgi:hypothetical protein